MILVTGASGFLGGNLLAGLRQQAIGVYRRSLNGGLTIDLAGSPAAAIRAVASLQISHVIHAAAVTPWSARVDYADDLKMASNIAAIANAKKVPRVTFLSGWNVYDMETGSAPYSEDTPLQGVGAYGQSKLAVERYLADNLSECPLTVLRLASIYGPGQVSPGLIPNLVQRALREGVIDIDNVHTRRDYLYIDDLILAVRRLIQGDFRGDQAVNIGSGAALSVQEVAEAVRNILMELQSTPIRIQRSSTIQEASLQNNQLEIGRARRLGLLTQPTAFVAGLTKYVLWSRVRACRVRA